MTNLSSPSTAERRDALAGRLVESAIAFMDVVTAYVGVKLGL